MKYGLSKSTYIRGLQCRKSLYLYKNRYFLRDPMPPEQQARLNRGSDVGELARSLFPGGTDVSPRSPALMKKAIEQTAALLLEEETRVIYEATFKADDVTVMMDILVRDGDGWIAYEVKSSLKVSQTYREDIALQYFVIRRSGLELKDIRILYLNEAYRLGESLDVRELLREESLLEYAREKQSEVEANIHNLLIVANQGSSPVVPIGTHCKVPYPCEFRGHCWKGVPENSALELSQLPEEERFRQYHEGRRLVREIIKDEHWTLAQHKQLDAFLEGNNQIQEDEVRRHLSALNPSCVAMQLLVTRPAVPIFKGHQPFQPILAGFAAKRHGSHEIILQVPDPSSFDPSIIMRQWMETFRYADTIICFDADEMKSYIKLWAEVYSDHAPELTRILAGIIDIKTLLLQGWFSPYPAQDSLDLASVAKVCGISAFMPLRIRNDKLAGEILRPMITGGRQLKGFEMKHIEEFLSVSVHALPQIADYLRKV
ncbi:MAG: hypothetical protein IH599_05505 [Bacteroidales bacterium]|nr:hypothetical protein [Bacteroidales bacterium]